ncbi:DgyrCDS13815 [Dimorphilus gyrociliatus]|uniref:DgyrCDS13815 n=1 Tax=Dimorphilus gyrociliatus TaxID=2664684 RepID=A0A7I8WBT6_9ANNE|nr:DgyrCDS13815 [Dimorphilus gyrociliatus]
MNNGRKLEFPVVRTILWDHKAAGKSIEIGPFPSEYPCININESTLSIIKSIRDKSKITKFVLIGSLQRELDHSLTIEIERHETENDMKKMTTLHDMMYIPCYVQSTNGPLPFSSDDYSKSIEALHKRCKTNQKISFCQFFHPLVALQIGDGLEIRSDMVYPDVSFTAIPIQNVPLVPSALAKNLASPYCRSYVLGEAQSGYLSMDQTRKVLLILESDPKVSSLPIVGIWISGVATISDPFVWACCCRYLFSNIKNRVHPLSEPFLVILYSTEHSEREVYDITPTGSKTSLGFDILTLSEDLRQNQKTSFDSNVHMLQFEKEKTMSKRALFGSCLKKYDEKMKNEMEKNLSVSLKSAMLDDLMPQPAVERDWNKPIQMKSEVPEVTLLQECTPEPKIQMRKLRQEYDIEDESVPKPPLMKHKTTRKSLSPLNTSTNNKSISKKLENEEPERDNHHNETKQQVPSEWLDILKKQNDEIKYLRSQVEKLVMEQSRRENVQDASVQSTLDRSHIENRSIGVNTSILENPGEKSNVFSTPLNQAVFKEAIQNGHLTSSPHDLLKSNATFGDLRIDSGSYETTRSERIIDMPDFNNLSSERFNQSVASPLLGESVSMYQQGGLQAVMPHFEEKESQPPSSKLFDEDYSSFSESEDENIENSPPKNRTASRGCSPIKSLQQTPQKLSSNNTTIDIAAKTRKELEALGICFDPDNVNFSFKPAPDGTLYLDTALLPKVQYTSLLLSSSECDDADSLALKYLNDAELTTLARGENKIIEPTIFQSNNMSFATRKYMERYGLVNGKANIESPTKDGGTLSQRNSLKPSTCPNTPLNRDIPKLEDQRHDSRLLDIEKLKALPQLL